MVDDVAELADPRGPVRKVQPEDRATGIFEHLGIAGGLGCDQLAEAERPFGDSEILRGRSRNL